MQSYTLLIISIQTPRKHKIFPPSQSIHLKRQLVSPSICMQLFLQIKKRRPTNSPNSINYPTATPSFSANRLVLPPAILPKLALLAFFFFAAALLFASFSLSADLSGCWEKSFHLRQPSKSISACMQPHSITLRSSQTKLTGFGVVSLVYKEGEEGVTNLGKEIVTSSC